MQLLYQNIKERDGALSRVFVQGLAGACKLRSLIETGTYLGDTLDRLHDDFEALASVELSAEFYAHACERFAQKPKIQLLNDDSARGLDIALSAGMPAPGLIWLDAHYSGGSTAKGSSNSPVVNEITSILKHASDGHVVLIDDLRYFWNARDGFLTHEALSDYPSVSDVVKHLNSGTVQFACFVLCDALLAIPQHQVGRALEPSDVLVAITASRTCGLNQDQLKTFENTIATATGSEREAILDIPDYLVGQNSYGLGGHYFYWRALVRHHDQNMADALEDTRIALKCGVIPEGSLLAHLQG